VYAELVKNRPAAIPKEGLALAGLRK